MESLSGKLGCECIVQNNLAYLSRLRQGRGRSVVDWAPVYWCKSKNYGRKNVFRIEPLPKNVDQQNLKQNGFFKSNQYLFREADHLFNF